MPTSIGIRAAEPADESGILAVVDEAFADETRDASEELDIVRGTWAARDDAERIEFVAVAVAMSTDDDDRGDEDNDETDTIVGHVLAAMGDLDGQPVAGVAPLCVAPAHQRTGVGLALMGALFDEAARRGWPYLVLLGDPAYYARFGFTPAARLGISYAPAGRDSPHFLVRAVGPTSAAPPGGEYRYCWEL
jgi:putative acetyltransferase